MIGFFLIGAVGCFTNFEELLSNTADGYNKIGYTAADGWTATAIAETDVATTIGQIKNKFTCVGTDSSCNDLSTNLAGDLAHQYEFHDDAICKENAGAEIASSYLYGFLSQTQPSLYYVAGCAVEGKDQVTAESVTVTPKKCAATGEATHPLSALQGILDKFPYSISCYASPEAATAPLCEKPESCTGAAADINQKYIANYQLGYVKGRTLPQVKEHIAKYGPLLMKVAIVEGDLASDDAFFTEKGLYCSSKTHSDAEKFEWVEVVGWGTDVIPQAQEDFCDATLAASADVDVDFLTARSQHQVEYLIRTEGEPQKTTFKIPLGMTTTEKTLTDPLNEATEGDAKYSGFFLYYRPQYTLFTTEKRVISYDTDKIYTDSNFDDTKYIKLNSGKDTADEFTLFDDAALTTIEQAKQLHKDTLTAATETEKFLIDSLYLTAKLHKESLTVVASVSATLGTLPAIGAGDNYHYLKAGGDNKYTVDNNLELGTQFGLAKAGLILSNCIEEDKDSILATTTTLCTSEETPAIQRVATGYQTVRHVNPNEATLKKLISYYGPVVAKMAVIQSELNTHMAEREAANDVLKFSEATTGSAVVLVVGWKKHQTESNTDPITAWFCKVSVPDCQELGTYVYLVGHEAVLPTEETYSFVKEGTTPPGPGPEGAAFSFLPPMQMIIALLSFILLL